MRIPATAACVLWALAAAAPAIAQGQGNGRGHGPGTPPSRNSLAPPVASAPSGGASPFAWLEDASILEPGSVSAAISVTRWQGTDASEVDLPVVDVGIGLADRVHLAASVPRVVDSAAIGGPIGGVGTSFFTAKIALVDGSRGGLKVAASPTVELLGEGVVQSLGADARRVQFGLPVSAEFDRGDVRWFGGGGYFSGGVWFGGAGAGVRTTNHLFLSAILTRSWRRDETLADPSAAQRNRTDVSGGVAYAVTPRVSVFASAGHTVATADENGAGGTLGAGLAFFLPPVRK
jgi:hypothetical protein